MQNTMHKSNSALLKHLMHSKESFCATKEHWHCIVRVSQAVQHAVCRFLCVLLQRFCSRMSSYLLAALTGLSDSEPVCAAAFINPTLCDFVSTSLFLSLSFTIFYCPFLKLFSHTSLFLQIVRILHRKIKNLSLLTRPHVVQSHVLSFYLYATQKQTVTHRIPTQLFSKQFHKCPTWSAIFIWEQ